MSHIVLVRTLKYIVYYVVYSSTWLWSSRNPGQSEDWDSSVVVVATQIELYTTMTTYTTILRQIE